MEFSFPDVPNNHAIFAIVITLLAFFLFTRKNLAIEISSLIILVIISLFFAVFPYVDDGHAIEPYIFFSGFGHEALVTVCALMVLGQGLVQTGALEPFGRFLTKAWTVAPFFSLLVTLILSAILSAFINNTPIVVLMLPILISVSFRTKTSAGKVLMPMGFATLVGGMSTTIGTSTNLLVVSVANDLGLARMEMFDFFVPAAIVGCVAILYLWLIAPLLLPANDSDLVEASPRLFQARLHLDENSPAIGKSVTEVKKLISDGINLVRIRRGENYLMPLPDVVLKDGDKLRVMDTSKKIRAAAETLKATLYSGEQDVQEVDEDHPLQAEDQVVAEIAIVNGSNMDGQNLRLTRFFEIHQLIVLALHRQGRDIWKADEEIMDVTMQQGDVLLVQGSKESIHKLKISPEFLVLDASEEVPQTEKAPIALVTILVVVILSALGLVPIAVSSLAGSVFLLLSRCLNLQSAIRAINSSVIFVVTVSLAIGLALEITGASDYITQVFLYFFRDSPPYMIMSALMLLIAIMTNIVSNNAAAVIGTPIAVNIANQLGVAVEPFVLAILFGANLSFATPMSYKTNLLVMSAGNYSFNDFLRVGIPLTILMWLSFSYVLAVMYL